MPGRTGPGRSGCAGSSWGSCRLELLFVLTIPWVLACLGVSLSARLPHGALVVWGSTPRVRGTLVGLSPCAKTLSLAAHRSRLWFWALLSHRPCPGPVWGPLRWTASCMVCSPSGQLEAHFWEPPPTLRRVLSLRGARSHPRLSVVTEVLFLKLLLVCVGSADAPEPGCRVDLGFCLLRLPSAAPAPQVRCISLGRWARCLCFSRCSEPPARTE